MKKLEEGLPISIYDSLVSTFRKATQGYTAPAYDIVLAMEEAFILNGIAEGLDQSKIQKNRNEFLKNAKLYIDQRVKLKLQI